MRPRERAWLERLHAHRQRELQTIFGRCPDGYFERGLELGAGDGFQSSLLRRWVRWLVASEVNRRRLAIRALQGVTPIVCDAMEVSRCFRAASFDLIFSSHLLEHLPEPARAVQAMIPLLRPGGVWIGVMPSPFMKLTWLALFYPNRLAAALAALRDPGRLREAHSSLRGTMDALSAWDNNPSRRRYGFLRRQIWPVPHGDYRTNVEEVFQYSRRRWVRLLEGQGLQVVSVLRMPVTTGYTMDWAAFRRAAERVGLGSAYAYIAKRAGAGSSLAIPWERGFEYG
jgi:SAM-dependent methyltransferase